MNQEHAFSSNDVYDFLKILVELGGVHYIDNTYCIFRSDDQTPVGIKVGAAKKQIALYKEGTKIPPDAVYLNPFNELLGKHPEQDWFMNTISVIPGCLLMYTMKKMAEMITNKKEDTPVKTAALISKFVGRVDEKFINELGKIRALDMGMIFYDKQKHIAQLLCDLWEEEFEEKLKTKIRKSSLVVMREMAEEILKTSTPEQYTYTATIIACPRFDAVAHVLVETLTAMHDIVEKITGVDLHTDELNEHLKHLEAYHKALQWLATSSASPMNEKSPAKTVANAVDIPWNVETKPTLNVEPVTCKKEDSVLGNVEVVGFTKNPTFSGGFGNGEVVNPTYGMGGGGFGGGGWGGGQCISGLGCVSAVVPKCEGPDFSRMTSAAAARAFTGLGGIGC